MDGEKPHERRRREIHEFWAMRREKLRFNRERRDARAAIGYGVWVREAVKPERSGAKAARTEFATLRERAGLTPTQLAERMGVERSTVHRMENGERRDMTLNAMERYANACGFEVRVSFDESTNPKVAYVKR